jgi:DNA-binding CsgD family transcriptional regulator
MTISPAAVQSTSAACSAPVILVRVAPATVSVGGEMIDLVAYQDTATPIVGRDRELADISRHLGLGGEPQSRSVLLAGDAGVGKTRLLAELVDRLTTAGWHAVVGHCLDFADTALPYLPFTEIFGRLATSDPEVAARLAQEHPALTHIQPGRRTISGTADRPSENLDRGELFDAVHGALDSLGASAPLLVVVEDVHWADQSTRDLLRLLFARPFESPVSVLASYRTDDLHRRHPLRAAVAEWARLPGLHRVQLGPLADSDVRRLVGALHEGSRDGGPRDGLLRESALSQGSLREASFRDGAPGHRMSESDLHAIVERAEGNAFFAEELMVASELGCRGLPDDLADLLLVRLDRLGDHPKQVVRAASCAGRRVSHVLLSQVVDQSDDELERSLRAAVESNVLVQVGADGYAFRHALLAEAVYDDLLPGERARIHAAYARALSSRMVDGTAAELARHARAAHDLDTAIRASIDAGDDAMSVGGPDEAAQHYEAALELLSNPRRPIPQDIDLVSLVVSAAEAVTAAGHLQRAVALVEDQLRQLSPDAPPEHRARLLMAMATAASLIDVPTGALEATTEALSLIDDEPTPLRAKLLSLLAVANTHRGRDEEAARHATEALGLAQKLDLPRVVADATTTLAGIDERGGDLDAARLTLEQIVLSARGNGHVAAEIRGLFLLGGLHHERAEYAEAQRLYALAENTARAAGQPWAPYGFDARMMGALTAYQRGLWDDALVLADYSGQSPPPLSEAMLNSVRMLVGAGRGDPAVLAFFEPSRPFWEREGLLALVAGVAAIDLYGDRGDVAAMLAVHDDVVANARRIWQEHFAGRIRLSALVLGQLASAAASAPVSGRDHLMAPVPDLVAAAESVRRRIQKRKQPLGPEGVAWLARSRSEHLRLRWLADIDPPPEAELVSAWEDTVAGFVALGHPFETARSKARLASVYRAMGRTREAADDLGAARETALRLGAQPLLAELRGLGASRGRDIDARRDTDLTTREREILGLVAQGRSNGEIARQLFISAKTVSVHVSNILAKLGAGGRTEAVAIARRNGLLPE